jgi:hypothetical protein
VHAGETTKLKRDDKSALLPPIPASLAAMTSASSDTEVGDEPAVSASSEQGGGEQHGRKQKGGGPPVSAGSSKFVWYAVAVVTAATIIAVHAAYESPDRP